MSRLDEKTELFRIVWERLSSFEKADWEENFLVEYTHDSTAIEGNTLTRMETKMILTDKIVPAETTLKELDEVRDHAAAWQYVKEQARHHIPLSENMIRNIHTKVLPVDGIGGHYRAVPVYIRGAQHVPIPPQQVWNAMKNFFYRMEHDAFVNPIEKAAFIHAEFVKIHPFQDGNGRTARLLMNYHLLANDLPPTSIKQKNRQAYFETLEAYAVHDTLSPFVHLLRQNMERELDGFLSMYAIHIDGHTLREIKPSLVPLAKAYRTQETPLPERSSPSAMPPQGLER